MPDSDLPPELDLDSDVETSVAGDGPAIPAEAEPPLLSDIELPPALELDDDCSMSSGFDVDRGVDGNAQACAIVAEREVDVFEELRRIQAVATNRVYGGRRGRGRPRSALGPYGRPSSSSSAATMAPHQPELALQRVRLNCPTSLRGFEPRPRAAVMKIAAGSDVEAVRVHVLQRLHGFPVGRTWLTPSSGCSAGEVAT